MSFIQKNYDGTKSFRYVLYNLGDHALIYEARLIDFHEYAYLHDVIQCLKALLYWILFMATLFNKIPSRNSTNIFNMKNMFLSAYLSLLI